MGTGRSEDRRRVLSAQALRAFAYGLGAVILGVTLKERGLSPARVGGVLAAVVAGTVLTSIVIARWGDRWGRRRCYVALYLALAVTGVTFALSDQLWLLILVALTGALSTEVVESGPFTSLEQPMLASAPGAQTLVRGFGTYNAVATAAGSLGALAAGGLGPLRGLWPAAPSDQRAFLMFVPVALAGAVLAAGLTPRVEAHGGDGDARDRRSLGRSRGTVLRLAGL